MLINEIFKSIDGEGIRTGYPVTFIRSYGCNLLCTYCFGPNKFGKYPNVTMADLTKKPLNEVKIGDVILTFDNECKNLVTTTVQDVGRRQTDEYHSLATNNTNFIVTKEHPFFVNNDWVSVEDIKIGDKLKNASSKDYMNYCLNIYKQDLYNYTKYLLQQYKQLEDLNPEECKNIGKNNGQYKEDFNARNYASLKYMIKKGYAQLDIINGVPCKKLVVHHLDGNKDNDSEENLVVITHQQHNAIHARGELFWNKSSIIPLSGVPVVRNSFNKEVPQIGYKQKEVINLTCEPYNTFLIDDIYVHNCDTLYAVDPQTEEDKENAFVTMTPDEILAKCKEFGLTKITFTGGEPLIQKDAPELVALLLDNDYEVNIETNGAVDIHEFNDRLVDVLANDVTLNNLIYTLDYKCPSSGMEDKMILDNIDYLNDIDVLKFVVGTQEDLDKMKQIVEQYTPECNIFVSPVFGQIEPKDIVQYILDNNLQNVRVQLQLHKLIWNVNQRGV